MSDPAEPAPPAPQEPKMEIHKPKPVHSWRELLTEIGVIVIGILIALSLEQAVEKWREHQLYLSDRQAVRTELGLTMYNQLRRADFVPCLERRLDEVSAVLDRAEAHQPFTPLTWIGSPATFLLRTTAESDLSRSDLFPSSELDSYGLVYAWAHSIAQFQEQEQLAWSHLRPLEGRTSIPPEMISSMRTAIGEARMENDRIRNVLDFFRIMAKLYDIPLVPNPDLQFLSKTWPICLPTSATRAQGEAMQFDRLEK